VSRQTGIILFVTVIAAVQAAITRQPRSLILLALLASLLAFSHWPVERHHSAGSTPGAALSSRTWWTAFLLVLGLSAALVLYFNPDGRLPWNQRERYLYLPTRTVKPQFYRRLPRTPDLVLFGSSVSFTMPAEYVEEQWGIDTFNMSVSGGSPSDLPSFLKFMIDQSPDGRAPSVVTMELLWSDLRPYRGSAMPMDMLPYMDLRTGSTALFDMLDSPFRLDSVLSSILTALFLNSPGWVYDVKFTPEGTTIRLGDPLSPEEYHQNMSSEITLQKRVMYCRELDPAGVAYIDQIVALSEKYHIGIVFYRPPVNGDFYNLAGIQPYRFRVCKRLLDEHMKALASQHPGIFYKDLAYYKPIANLGPQIYIDPRHLTREGNILVLNALRPKINAALTCARQNR
jgi:hypothetical protein